MQHDKMMKLLGKHPNTFEEVGVRVLINRLQEWEKLRFIAMADFCG